MAEEDCVMWSMVGTQIYKKCAQVYKLEERIEELENALLHIAEDGCPKCGNVAEQALKKGK